MGRRRQRKRNRKMERRSDRRSTWEPTGMVAEEDIDDLLFAFADRPLAAERATTCGQCREFIEDGEFGRGTCLHPASGVLSPWDNTPGCPYFARGRRMP